MSNNRIIEEKVRAARAKVAEVRPYFAHAVYSYILVEVPEDSEMYSMACDVHKRLYYNPRFVNAMTIPQLVPFVLHELGHSLRDHHIRARAMGVSHATAMVANVAQDYEINDDLRAEIKQLGDVEQMAKIPLPDFIVERARAMGIEVENPSPVCYPEQRGFDEDETWEFYYQKMLENAELLTVTIDCGSGAHGATRPWEHGDPDGMTGATEGVSDADWEDIKQQTAEAIAEHQRTRGNVPGGWLAWAGDLLRPKRIPWDQELSGQLRWGIADTTGQVLHSYKRPSRRSSAMRDFCLPSMRRPKPFVVIVGDTSGSMSDRDLSLVRGVVEDICMSMGAQVAFLATDAEVHGGIQQVHDGRRVKLMGRGGTNMCVGIQYALDNLRPRPDVIVCVTDCGTGWPATKLSGCRLIVAAVGADETSIANVPQWARVVRVDPENTSRRSA